MDFYNEISPKTLSKQTKNWPMQTLTTLLTYLYLDIMNLKQKIIEALRSTFLFWDDDFPYRPLLVLEQQDYRINV